MENHCPHQGGPLGEGSIEKGLLRCPWHGYDYDPITGQPPSGFSDSVASFPVERRLDGSMSSCLISNRPFVRSLYAVVARDNHNFGKFNRIGPDAAGNPDWSDPHQA